VNTQMAHLGDDQGAKDVGVGSERNRGQWVNRACSLDIDIPARSVVLLITTVNQQPAPLEHVVTGRERVWDLEATTAWCVVLVVCEGAVVVLQLDEVGSLKSSLGRILVQGCQRHVDVDLFNLALEGVVLRRPSNAHLVSCFNL